MADFESGIELNRAFYEEVVGALLEPWPHTAALLGWGSEILGNDTPRSTDHGWGPRLRVFVSTGDVEAARRAIDEGLPDEFHGWPIRFGWDAVEPSHRVGVDALGNWLERHLGCDGSRGMTTLDWLLAPQHLLLGVTRGAVYHDDGGRLEATRTRLAYFPDGVWRWIIACQWQRVAQEEAFVGRAAEVGDDLGARLIAARQVQELMRLWFLFAREYWPYPKWFGSTFAQLPGADAVAPLLAAVLDARGARDRESALVSAYEAVARRHNEAGVTEPVDPAVRPFYGRGYRVLMAERFVNACRSTTDEPLLVDSPLVGSVDLVTDSTDVLSVASRARQLRELFVGEHFPDVHGDP